MPENHDIYDTATYMLRLSMWVQQTGQTKFRRQDLPEYLKCRWLRRAQSKRLVHPVGKHSSDGTITWKLCPKYHKLTRTQELKPREEIDDDKLIALIEQGVNTRPELADALLWSTPTIYRHVSKLVDKGILKETKCQRRCVYHVIE